METTRYTLSSNELVNTPGLARWAQNGARFERDRPKMIKVFVDGYGLPKAAAEKIVDGHCTIDDAKGTVAVEV